VLGDWEDHGLEEFDLCVLKASSHLRCCGGTDVFRQLSRHLIADGWRMRIIDG
jgi:hypothetical protein